MVLLESFLFPGINLVSALFNLILDSLAPWVALIFFLGYDIFYFIKNRKKRDVIRQITIWFLVEILVVCFFWIIPWLMIYLFPGLDWVSPYWKWILLFTISFALAYFYGHENGKKRWRYSVLGHLVVLLFGWFTMNRWGGILFFSIPVIIAYYSILYIMAMVTLPTSNPEDGKERWKRFLILASYSWGFQFPIIVVADHAWKKPETRIKGDFTRDYNVPGMIWTKSHQVVGITGGTQFNRVDGPGVIFTRKLEQPFQVIDLRLQLRNHEIDVVSKDGLSFIVRVLAGFRMDPETWNNKTYAQLRALNPLLQNAKEPSYTAGSFPYSHRRIQAALGTTSVEASASDHLIQWDQWALSIIDEETRKIVSQKNLDEFWRPLDDTKGANAMNEIAKELKERSEWTLRSKGILLVVSRIVNFRFSSNGNGKMDEISKQQIAAWGADWERRRAQRISDANAEVERNQQEARAYAATLLLNSIADALKKAHEISPTLPKRVIAMRYLSALQDYAHTNTPEEEEKIKEWHNLLRE